MASVVRPFRGVPAEDRLAQRRADLLDAGLDEVAEVGVAKLRMSTVCQRAGLTQRYFYEHFRNRDELLEAMIDAMIRDLLTGTVAAVEAQPSDLFARSQAAMDFFLTTIIEDPRLGRLYAEADTLPSLAARKATALTSYAEFATSQVISLYGTTDNDTQLRMRLAAQVIVSGHANTTLAWQRGEIKLARTEYVDTIAKMFVDALLGIRNPA
ncbi:MULTISPECIES: TetR/AcrR family transcriptional regulator [unclassified Nocardia]|uniref:TetR/AcrR family transcriptional regulator n=1 Tax=unclassified Nocardia TaxID=2637762 RepID=UPI0035E168F5